MLFTRQIEHIDDYIEHMQDADFSAQEQVWEKRFYRDELKAAVLINHLVMERVREQEQGQALFSQTCSFNLRREEETAKEN